MYNENFTTTNLSINVTEAIPYREAFCIKCNASSNSNKFLKIRMSDQQNGRWICKCHLEDGTNTINRKEVQGKNSKRCINHRLVFLSNTNNDIDFAFIYAFSIMHNLDVLKINQSNNRRVISELFTSNNKSAKIFNALACKSDKVFVQYEDNSIYEVKSWEEYKKLTDKLA